MQYLVVLLLDMIYCTYNTIQKHTIGYPTPLSPLQSFNPTQLPASELNHEYQIFLLSQLVL
jgi:hypothetical protein